MTVTEVLGVWFVSRDLLGYSGKPGQLREAIVLVLWGNLHSLEQLSISRMLASAGTRHNVPESLLPQVGVHRFLIVTEPSGGVVELACGFQANVYLFAVYCNRAGLTLEAILCSLQ